jgi:hypothetical protein
MFYPSWPTSVVAPSSAPPVARRGGPLMAAGLFALLSAASPAALASDDGFREFHAYGIEVFEKIGDACDGGDLDWTRNQAHNYFEVFDDWQSSGDWGESLYFEDNDVDGRDFTDASNNNAVCSTWQTTCSATGADSVNDEGADSADVVFLSTHGSYDGSEDSLSWKMGDDDNDCSVKTNSGVVTGNMYWNGDAEVLIVDACNSARFAIWDDSFDASPNEGITNMLDPNGSMNTLLGYHGLSPDRSWGKNYAKDAYWDGIGEDWVVEGTDFGNMSGNQDTCAVSIIFGDDRGDREHMHTWGGFNDREDTGDPTLGSTYFIIGGCDPEGGDPVN